jgi:hypothetical protein
VEIQWMKNKYKQLGLDELQNKLSTKKLVAEGNPVERWTLKKRRILLSIKPS